MLSAHDAADFFLSPVAEEEGEQITNLKLQKLLYYAQGYALSVLGRPMFAERIEHWQHGPVVPDVYRTYKQHGASPLPVAHIEIDKYSQDDLYILNRVRTEQGRYTAWALREKTHQESPWLNTSPGQEISISLISEYFCSLMPETAFNYDLENIQKAAEGNFVSTPRFDNPADLLDWMEAQ